MFKLLSPTKKQTKHKQCRIRSASTSDLSQSRVHNNVAQSVIINKTIDKKLSSESEFVIKELASGNKMINNSVQTGMDRYVTVVASKRKASPLAKANIKSSKPNTEIETKNRFEVLGASTSGEQTIKIAAEKPPPIYLREKASPDLIARLKDCAKNDFFVVPMKRGLIEETKIQLKNVEHFRIFRDYLDSLNKHYYTYQLKSARGLCVVIKGLESDTDIIEIKEDLEEQGFKVKNIMNIFNKNKIPQPMFKVELESENAKTDGKNHPIYSLRYVLYRKVCVEEPYKRNSVVQCFKCQEYGHTKGYCKLPDICVVCGNLHSTADCTLEKSSNLKKCNNCGENHTANYKGCQVYKIYLEKLQFKQRREQKSANRTFKINEGKLKAGVSFSDCVQERKQEKIQEEYSSDSIQSGINELTRMMCTFMESMEKNMSQMLQNMSMMMQLMIKNQK